MDLNLQF